ncbi:restriction endonuclease subunit S [Nibribacter koreensis]|uniref:Restriction endonuclease subunit S n=1 Tax=Nibribacter koreensis TaxID=1084519 RepID=A0ABP8FDC4_9BACT
MEAEAIITLVKNVPVLRFQEFEDFWMEKRLKELTKLITKGTTPNSFSDKGAVFVKIEALNGKIIEKNKCLFVDELIHQKELKRSILQENDLLFAIAGATIGKVAVVTNDILPANTNQALAIIRLANTDNLDYLLHLLQSKVMKRYIYMNISVGAQPNLNLEQIGSFTFHLPSLAEQQKIASFLTAVDDKIQHLSKKKDLLEMYKRGAIQQIFSQQIRFRDENGNAFPVWEEKKLAEVCDTAKSGGTPASTKKEYYDGDIPFLSISDMTSQGKYLKYTSNHISELGLRNSSAWIIPVDTIIYSMYASVGFVAINKIPIATSQAVLNLIINKRNNVEFIYYSLVKLQESIAKYITTGTQSNLNAQTVKAFEIQVPCLEEQNKIANFLISIDNKIDIIKKQLEQAKLFKKGLLQQMFV